MLQNDMFNLRAKEALKNIWCGDSHFDVQIKKNAVRRTLLIFMGNSRTLLRGAELTLKLIAAVLLKLFLVEQIQDWTKLKIHWN